MHLSLIAFGKYQQDAFPGDQQSFNTVQYLLTNVTKKKLCFIILDYWLGLANASSKDLMLQKDEDSVIKKDAQLINLGLWTQCH